MRLLLPAILLASPLPAAAQTLLVGNKSEDTLSFIDLATGTERARVATGDMPHEIAISPDGKQAAVVAYGSTTLDIFDVATAKLSKRVDIAPNSRPHGIAWLDDGRIIATTEGSETLTLLSADLAKVEQVSTAQKTSHMVAIGQQGGLAYVANIGSGSVTVIDIETKAKLADIAVGGRPEGIALSPDGRWLWVGDLAEPVVHVVDTKAREIVTKVGVDPVAIRVLFSPDGRWVVTSNIASGNLSVIDAATRKLVRTIKVSGEQAAGQVTILFSRDGKRIYAAETGRDRIAEIDFASGEVLRRIPAGKNGDGLAIAP